MRGDDRRSDRLRPQCPRRLRLDADTAACFPHRNPDRPLLGLHAATLLEPGGGRLRELPGALPGWMRRDLRNADDHVHGAGVQRRRNAVVPSVRRRLRHLRDAHTNAADDGHVHRAENPNTGASARRQVTEEVHRRVVLPGPILLGPTMRRFSLFLSDPTIRARGSQVWCAFRTAQGPATVRYVQIGERTIDVSAWGPARERAIELAPAHLGADDRPEDFVPTDPRIASLHERFRGLRFGRSGRVLESLVPAILAQKVSGKGATRSWHELLFRCGEPAPPSSATAPKLWLMPAPERLRDLHYYELHPIGVERRRAEVIRAAANAADRLERAAAEGRDALWRRLSSIRGVGPWTAAIVVGAALGDADAVQLGDYHIPSAVVHAMTGMPRGDDEQMLELLEPFRPHRARVIALLAAGAPAPPRFGPRKPVRDIRRM